MSLINDDREWPSLKFARVDVGSPKKVAEYILWLANWSLRPVETSEDNYVSLDPAAMVESMWGWDGAPKKRMAKLLWQLMVGDSSPEHFDRRFTLNVNYIAEDIASSVHFLAPIQQNLTWILDALIGREQEDIRIGQGSWGEDWWLPADQAAYLRQQIRRAHPDLIEKSSCYQDFLESAFFPYFEVKSDDPDREYTGSVQEKWGDFVEIASSDDQRTPLRQAHQPFAELAGTGFSWGYQGGGPSLLALSILADAVGGDFHIAEKLRGDFVRDFLAKLSQHMPFTIRRKEVLTWIETKGIGPIELKAGASRVTELMRKNRNAVSKHKEQLEHVNAAGGLLAQRFDLVPEDFESALYVDLMQSLEHTGWVLRCTRCKQPLPSPDTPTGNRQRARWRAGRSIYHEECFIKHRLERKRTYWKERAQDPAFRDQERMRARKRRKIL